MSKTFEPKDFESLQNAICQLSVLAASVPAFQSAIVASRQILSAIDESEKDRDKTLEELTALKANVSALEQEIAALEGKKDELASSVRAAEARLAGAEGKHAAVKERFDRQLAEHQQKAEAEGAHALETASKAAQEQLAKLSSAVVELEKRKGAAEAALQGIKASI